MKPYTEAEKDGVHDILRANPNILDVEIAFGIGGTDEAGASAPRVDLAAIRTSDQCATIVLYEAKHFKNRQALRADVDRVPKVVEQIESYRRLLEAYRDAVIDSYRLVCGNLLSLRGVAERHPKRHAILRDIASGSLRLDLDPRPRLAVFGYDEDQRRGKKWRPHRKKLRKQLGERFLSRGSCKGFGLGNSE